MPPASSAKPSTSTSDFTGPIWRGGKFTTARYARAGQLFQRVARGDLRRLEGANAYVDLEEIVKADIGGGGVRVLVVVHARSIY